MREDLFVVNDILIDYNLLGRMPEELKKVKYDKFVDKFIECFEYTFTNTVFSYYGTISEIKELIKDSIILEEIEIQKLCPEKQWAALLLVVEKMFLDMHATLLGSEVVNETLENIENLDVDELKLIIEDINLGIYFAVEENILVTPTSLKELDASIENVLILEELLNKEEEFEEIIANCKVGSNINKNKYEQIIKKPYNVKKYKKELYNNFIFDWIENLQKDYEDDKEFTNEELEELYSEIFATVLTYSSVFFDNPDIAFNLSEELYLFLVRIFEEKYNIEEGPEKSFE